VLNQAVDEGVNGDITCLRTAGRRALLAEDMLGARGPAILVEYVTTIRDGHVLSPTSVSPSGRELA